MNDNIFQNLRELLEDERAALLAGNLEGLPDYLVRKQTALRKLESEKTKDADGLREVQTMMLRNQELMESALQGIRSVANSLETARKIRASLETYDVTGHRQIVNVQQHQELEKRA